MEGLSLSACLSTRWIVHCIIRDWLTSRDSLLALWLYCRESDAICNWCNWPLMTTSDQYPENSPRMLEPVRAKTPSTAKPAECVLPAVWQCRMIISRMGINIQCAPIRTLQLVYKSASLSVWPYHRLYLILLAYVMLSKITCFSFMFPSS